jgi:hypothetical protein
MGLTGEGGENGGSVKFSVARPTDAIQELAVNFLR